MRPRYVRVGNCTVSTNNERTHGNVQNEFANRKNRKVQAVDIEPFMLGKTKHLNGWHIEWSIAKCEITDCRKREEN